MIKDNFNEFDDYDENENESYKLEFKNYNDEVSIIDELIDSLDIKNLESETEQNKEFNDNIRKTKNEYEIIMNCDESDYIIYYKK